MKENKLYIISENILTEGMKKTIKAKNLLENRKAKNISQAIAMVGLSRGAFYKYKDNIHKMASNISDIVSLMLILKDQSGVLSHVLNKISDSNANILTINQEIPLGNSARVSIYIKTKNMYIEPYKLINSLMTIDGVQNAKLLDGGN